MACKKIVSTILLVLWMVVIFIFSNEDAIKSQMNSDKVAKKTINTVTAITGKEYSENQKDNFVINHRFIIRKTAHFILYFILGVLVYMTLDCYGVNKKIALYSILICFIYSVSDEMHQLFSDGRTFKIIDIIIDTTGSTISSSFMYLIKGRNLVK